MQIFLTLGIFIIQNVNNPAKSWVWFDGQLRPLSMLTAEVIENAIDAIDQSPQPFQTTLYTQRYGFFTRNPIRGAGKSKPPPYVKACFLETWREQTYQNKKINCGAFAIAYQQALDPTKILNVVRRRAIEIQEKMKWGEYVTSEDLLRYVDVYPEYRLTIVIQSINCYDRHTKAGAQYSFESVDGKKLSPACKKKTLYVVWDANTNHYGCTRSPLTPRNAILHSHRMAFCHKCVTCYNIAKTCNCDLQIEKPKPPPIVCATCKQKPCISSGCTRQCRLCGTSFKKGYNREDGEGHRCLIYYEPNEDTNFNETAADSKYYNLWVYDLEARTTVTFTDSTYFLKENNEFVLENEEYVVATRRMEMQKVNMVVYRNVFTNEEKVLFGDDALKLFITEMLQINEGKNLCIAHNGSGYDSRLVLEELSRLELHVKTSITSTGNKFMEIKTGRTKFRDSLMHLPGSLSNLAKAFNLPLMKGTFPHLFNSVENYSYNGEIPPKSFFDLTFTAYSAADIDKFNTWYNERAQRPWNFMTELTNYCVDDVRILAMIVKKHHDICTEKFELSPWNFITAPSYCHAVIKWQLSKKLDLPPKEDPHRLVYIEDCAWNTYWGVLHPQEYWFARQALIGGRTDARRIHYHLSDEDRARGLEIRYQDIVSMYPFVQACDELMYPVGLPRIKVYDPKFYPCTKHQAAQGNTFTFCSCPRSARFADRQVDVEEFDEQPSLAYIQNRETFGIICVSMTPPKNLFHPVLVTWDATTGKRVANLNEVIEQTYTLVEVQKALEKGYVLNKVHRFDQYNKKPGLWGDFVRDLYIEKLANSDSIPSEEEQTRLVNAYESKFKIGAKVKDSFPRWEFRSALRLVFKIMLNSGWGKHCQRPNLTKLNMVDADDTIQMENLFSNIQANDVSLKNIQMLGNSTVYTTESKNVNYVPHDLYLPAGLFVPAYGRLMLYEALDMLQDRVLYHDTDSVIYIYDPSKENIPTGDIWGEWDEEKVSRNGNIEAFIGMGAKSYALKTREGPDLIKLKGLTIKHSHRYAVNFEELERLVLERASIQIPQRLFVYKIGEGIHIEERLKKLSFEEDNLKGFLVGTIVYPHGYCKGCLGVEDEMHSC